MLILAVNFPIHCSGVESLSAIDLMIFSGHKPHFCESKIKVSFCPNVFLLANYSLTKFNLTKLVFWTCFLT